MRLLAQLRTNCIYQLRFPMPNTIRFHRVLTASPEKVYKAFPDPDAKANWLPPNGFAGKVHEMNAKVAGGYRMSFTSFTTGKSHDPLPPLSESCGLLQTAIIAVPTVR